MNVISYSHAYALYPRATFYNRISLSLLPANRLDATAVSKYTARGWKFIHTLPQPRPQLYLELDAAASTPENSEARSIALLPSVLDMHRYECIHCPHCIQRYADERSLVRAFPAGPRWIGDKHSWVLPLDMDGVDVPAPAPGSYAVGPPPTSRDPCFMTSWELVDRNRYAVVGTGERAKEISKHVIGGESFWYSYVLSEPWLRKAMTARCRRFTLPF
jgi:hypothetical protein